MVKEIELTRGQVALVDDKWYDELNQYKWCALWDNNTQGFYAARQEGYTLDGVKKKRTVRMHRVIMNTPRGMICDHVDHETLNNQEHNLRNVTNSQNMMNRRGPTKRNKLGVLGVHRNRKGYIPFIYINQKRTYLPTRATLEEAVEDRRRAEKEHYGEYSGGSNVL